jgi:hypothetical protein
MGRVNLIMIGSTDLNYSHVEWLFNDYFNFQVYDPNKTYNKNTCIFIISRPDYWNDSIIDQYLAQGFRLILANLWEARPYFLSSKFIEYQDNILVILGCQNPYSYGWKNVVSVSRWFWYNESLMYTCDSRCQYNNYTPNRTNNQLFLMPMRRSKQFRTQIKERLAPNLDRAIYSYVESWDDPRALPRYTKSNIEKIAPDRVFESAWYDDTFFTVAVETAVDRQLDMDSELTGMRTEALPCDLFVTEKTFKPIAFLHPFLVCGMQGTLKFLQDNGFETYDNIFDESYDSMPFFEDRLDIIYNNIVNFNKEKYLDLLTEQKIKHNYDRFYNRSAVLEGVNIDLIQPLMDWIHAT